MQLLFKNSKESSVIQLAIGCKEVEINFLGDLFIDGEHRGSISTSNNFMECDGQDFFYMSIKDTDDCCSI